MSKAIEHLRLPGSQRQLDEDGCEVGVSRQAVDEAVRDYDALAARLAEAERDAARYRFLRDQDGMGNIFMHTPTCDLDATIDREIAADSADGGV